MKADISLTWYYSNKHMTDLYSWFMTLRWCLRYLDMWVQRHINLKTIKKTLMSLEVQSSPLEKDCYTSMKYDLGRGEGHHMMPVSRYSAQPLLSPSLRVFPFIFLNAAHGLTAPGIRQLLSLPFHNKGEYFKETMIGRLF